MTPLDSIVKMSCNTTYILSSFFRHISKITSFGLLNCCFLGGFDVIDVKSKVILALKHKKAC